MSKTPKPPALPLDYKPAPTRLEPFFQARARFEAGEDSPRDYLERCLARVDAYEGSVKAFAASNPEGARAAADAATARYKSGHALGPVDGLPVGVKDLYQTADMPTQMNSPVYEGWESGLDSAPVFALREFGASILAKTTTTEFGVGAPPPTRNPFDLERTPGGSSSGSAAAVGCGMVGAALGTQLKGSIIRPAAYCANWALKPSFGALNRGGGHSTSPSGSHLGVHANALEDVWEISWFMAQTAGSDAGFAGLTGGQDLPSAEKPRRMLRMYSPGWDETDDASKEIFERFLSWLGEQGVEVLEPDDHPTTAAFEADTFMIDDVVSDIASWEMRWPLRAYRLKGDNMLSPQLAERVERGEAMTVEDYRRRLTDRTRFRARFAALAGHVDAVISPSSPGPAPKGMATGNPIYQTPTSALGAPVVTCPLLESAGLPFGVSLIGWPEGDDRLTGRARWLRDAWFDGE